MSEPSKLRLRFETVGSITAIVVGVAALWVSWDQGRVMRQEMRASVWPALQVDGFQDTSRGGLDIGLSLENAGVGPALIERISVYREGELVADLEALRAILGADVDVSFETTTGRILAAGSEVRPFVFHFEDPEALAGSGEDVISSAATGRITTAYEVEVCYCSTLGDCWVSDTRPDAPIEIERCDFDPASTF